MNHRLFLIIPPGLEDLALKEIDLKCPVSSSQTLKGGIELEGDIDWIQNAHALLKIPTRILLRVTEFKVRDFPKLHQKIEHFSWNKFLSHPEPEWEISCSRSRLMHTGRIEETLQDALNKALIRQPLSRDWEKKNYPRQTFYVRLHEDILTLSLDLTGEPLYKRGLQKIKGEAPIRENLAAAFLFELFEGLDGHHDLVDPMCGSATFLTEATHFHHPLHLRSFAFETSPLFKGKIFKLPSRVSPLPLNRAYGFDLNEELLTKVKAEGDLEVRVCDSLKEKLELATSTLMICNPPYGERIRIQGKRGNFLKEAWEKFLQVDRPYRFAWVLPSDLDDLFQSPKGYHLRSKRHLRNGGMAVTFWIWERDQKLS